MTEKQAKELSAAHSTFSIEKRYAAAPARVFKAFTDMEQKRRWMIGGENWTVYSYEADFRPGGWERSRFSFKDGPEMGNDTIYHEIVRDRRMVFSYSMTFKDTVFSASLVTITLEQDGKGTLLTYTEQGTHLDGFDNPAEREEGCRELLDKLGEELEGKLAA
ncbi:MAG TPA: SRPBCC family protein [Rhizobiaceae bacterium]|nr:SRPBCC family protein [Rhizobiaceae bacterium]